MDSAGGVKHLSMFNTYGAALIGSTLFRSKRPGGLIFILIAIHSKD